MLYFLSASARHACLLKPYQQRCPYHQLLARIARAGPTPPKRPGCRRCPSPLPPLPHRTVTDASDENAGPCVVTLTRSRSRTDLPSETPVQYCFLSEPVTSLVASSSSPFTPKATTRWTLLSDLLAKLAVITQLKYAVVWRDAVHVIESTGRLGSRLQDRSFTRAGHVISCAPLSKSGTASPAREHHRLLTFFLQAGSSFSSGLVSRIRSRVEL